MAILGIDEVGRGPLAGPLVVGAVILPNPYPDWVGELKDSKKLSSKKREQLSKVIFDNALAIGLGWVSAKEIDENGISKALVLATRRAVEEVQRAKVPFSQIIIDGKINFLKDTALGQYVSTVVKADDLIREVSAASIIAKVARDNYMKESALKYTSYGFEKHVGYGTSAHIKAIKEFGLCEEHRLSFEPCKSMVGFDTAKEVKKNTTRIGKIAEEKVRKHLAREGHNIIDMNFKTKMCEIDIISTYKNDIYFTEVKYRKSNYSGGGLAAVTKEKQRQMEFAAKMFLATKNEFNNFDPKLAVAEVEGKEFKINSWFVI